MEFKMKFEYQNLRNFTIIYKNKIPARYLHHALLLEIILVNLSALFDSNIQTFFSTRISTAEPKLFRISRVRWLHVVDLRIASSKVFFDT